MASLPGTQTLRFRGPNDKPKPSVAKKKHDGILQDQIRRTAKLPWSPSFAFALRMILLVRVSGAMYSNIDDCDEVYNFWEPLHFLDRGYGFQTWETSPQYAIRSWAYILLHILPTSIARFLAQDQKRVAFFAVRIFLAVLSSMTEVTLYRKVYERVNHRVGRYLFFILLFNAGMWNASAAFLPSSFAMYTGTLAFACSIIPSSSRESQRTLYATLLYATGAIVGWPFALALAIPFVIEELFVYSGDKVPAASRLTWMVKRWTRLFGCGAIAAVLLIPVVGIDSLAYGKFAVVPFNIVRYNILSSDRGPDLYGTSPWNFYLLNLLLNFNVILPFALLALPALAVTAVVDKNRLGQFKGSSEESSPFTVLALRLSPFYLWLGILTAQPHKEERFMFPAYTMLCFNAAVTVYLIRGWMETAFVSVTKSPYRASRTSIFSTFTLSVLTTTTVLSASRIAANWKYYHAPLSVVNHFEAQELPHLLNVTGMLPVPIPSTRRRNKKDEEPRIDLTPIKEFNLTLCYGKEWYRFPGHYLVPDGIRVEFIKNLILLIFSYLDLPDLASLAQVAPFLAELASDPVLHKNRLRVVVPSRIRHSLFGQGPQGIAFRPTVAELVHRGVMRGLSIERHWREGNYFHSHRSIAQYETSLKLARNQTSRIISMQLRQRKLDSSDFLKTLHQAHVLPDEESSCLRVSRSLLPVMRKLKWSIQKDKLSKKIRDGTVHSIPGRLNNSSLGSLEAFCGWLENRGRGIVHDNERVRLAICPDVQKKVLFYEGLLVASPL
ncbi:glycosyltransferase family 22 protein [Lentinula edodes]|uniref:Mannosyltransferase n=1 Tax=Lentinula edodes TaxID=5353 RepID=A0A1Q3DV63_LENED|nr:glycosyltransferase family 22 protein [Lentinula edodes]